MIEMTAAVRYYSRSGNTKKLAEAIAGAASTTAESVEKAITAPVDLLFLGGAIYAGNVDAHLLTFIRQLKPDFVKSVAVFSTAAGSKSIHPKVAELLKSQGIAVMNETFQCRGKFLLANKGSPNEKDCADAAAFAKKLINR